MPTLPSLRRCSPACAEAEKALVETVAAAEWGRHVALLKWPVERDPKAVGTMFGVDVSPDATAQKPHLFSFRDGRRHNGLTGANQRLLMKMLPQWVESCKPDTSGGPEELPG